MTPVLTYHAMRVEGSEYAANDLVAFAADLRLLRELGVRIVPLLEVVAAREAGLMPENCVALSCDDGSDFDYRDLPHPTAGPQRGLFTTLAEFNARHGAGAAHLTSFVIASPAARRHLDGTCMVGKGWWNDDWWVPAVASGAMHVANHSWDHNHETLPASMAVGARQGTFTSIETRALADAEIRAAQDHLRRAVPNPGGALFAYPYGESNEYLVRDYLPRFGPGMGLRAAFTDRAGYVTPDIDPWNLPRFVFGRDWKSPAELAAIVGAAR